MLLNTCAVTGHRDIPEEKVELVKQRLREEITLALADGFTVLLSGMAAGADLLFVEIVDSMRGDYPKLYLEAALPYRNRAKSRDAKFRKMLTKCNSISIHSEEYHPGCFFARNRYLVQSAQRVIAVYDGREKGGTASTVRYAYALEKDVRIIEL